MVTNYINILGLAGKTKCLVIIGVKFSAKCQ